MHSDAEEKAVVPSEPLVDLCFPLVGTALPVDHGYSLLGALARLAPDLHGDQAIGIHPIAGRLAGQRMLMLARGSQLALRVPVGRISGLIPLAGKRIDLDGHNLTIGVPRIRQLLPAPALRSRLVVIKGFIEGDPFLDAVRRQLVDRGISGQANLVHRQRPAPLDGGRGSGDQLVRRTLRIRDKEIVGFAVAITDLSPTDSIRLQEVGLGGRRRFGCGLFVSPPARDRSQ